MTTRQYHNALKRLGLTPHGVLTREVLGLGARALAKLAAGDQEVTPMLELLLRMYLRHGLPTAAHAMNT